jgi:hypothetical protein
LNDSQRALFRFAQKSPFKKSIGAAVLFLEKSPWFFQKNSFAPKKSLRPIFERSEKEGVN